MTINLNTFGWIMYNLMMFGCGAWFALSVAYCWGIYRDKDD